MKSKKPTPARVTKVSTLQITSDSKVVVHEHLENPDFVDSHCQIVKKVMLCKLWDKKCFYRQKEVSQVHIYNKIAHVNLSENL